MAWTYGTVGPAGIVLLIAPLLVARQTLQVYVHLKQAYEGTIRSLVAAIEAKDSYTRGHSERVAGYAESIGRELALSEESIRKLRIAALLHDLGKLGIQRRILSKTGRLTEDEFGLMQEHPELATAILRDVSFLEDIIPAIYHHHEHYDGSGYVRNLKGEQIPLTARILAVADAYDAMISARPYRDALTPEMAAAELVSCSGSQFDRKAVDALLAATGVQPQVTEEIGISKGQLRFVDETT
jgi:putative nucleotidyltransferase with HDIG domain